MSKKNSLDRIFIPGDEWVYYKFYTGYRMADFILKDIIKPLTEKYLSENVIDKWFFVRYSDPGFHLRLRFHYSNMSSLNKIISGLNHLLKPYIEKNLIWKVQIDSYQREIERYGPAVMEMIEELFYFDSVMTVNMLALLDGDEGESVRWHFAMKSVDVLLYDFGLSLHETRDLLANLKEGFGKEFGMNRRLKRQVDRKYREEFSGIKAVMRTEKESLNVKILNVLQQRSDSNRLLIEKILEQYKKDGGEPGFLSVVSSIIHMSMNRMFISKHRMHEMVIYDFLFRYYNSEIAQKKYNK
ncbi:MAG: thiopeptide-type bacteriocin biosynthesis protein [Bacteroidales bacterium]|nr:thiopeptide-type bacteriocin biosynthesis protein [Bacteroidales bacterium]